MLPCVRRRVATTVLLLSLLAVSNAPSAAAAAADQSHVTSPVVDQRQRSSKVSSNDHAVTGPVVGTQPIEFDEESSHRLPEGSRSPLWWSEVPAVQLAREYPHRWKEFLPSAGVVPARSEEAKRKLEKLDDTRVAATRKQTTRNIKPRVVGYNKNANEHEDDDDDDGDDDDDEEEEESEQESETEHDRRVMRHLQREAKREAKAAWYSAKRAARKVSRPFQQANASSSSKESGKASAVSFLTFLPSAFRWIWNAVKHTFRLCLSVGGYVWHAIRLSLRSLAYGLRICGQAFLSVWAGSKYLLGQILRPIRVLLAPVIYIWLGVKWTFWDVPSYYIFMVLREVYPLYVFCGAALALGTGIGLVCAVVLYVGAYVFQSSSPLEAHLDSWGSSGTTDINKRLDFEQQNEKMLRALASKAASASSGKSRVRTPGKRSGRRSTSLRRRRSAEEAQELLLQQHVKPRSRNATNDSDEEEDVPDYLRGLGKNWRPLPKAPSPPSSSSSSGASGLRNVDGGVFSPTTYGPSQVYDDDDYFSMGGLHRSGSGGMATPTLSPSVRRGHGSSDVSAGENSAMAMDGARRRRSSQGTFVR